MHKQAPGQKGPDGDIDVLLRELDKDRYSESNLGLFVARTYSRMHKGKVKGIRIVEGRKLLVDCEAGISRDFFEDINREVEKRGINLTAVMDVLRLIDQGHDYSDTIVDKLMGEITGLRKGPEHFVKRFVEEVRIAANSPIPGMEVEYGNVSAISMLTDGKIKRIPEGYEFKKENEDRRIDSVVEDCLGERARRVMGVRFSDFVRENYRSSVIFESGKFDKLIESLESAEGGDMILDRGMRLDRIKKVAVLLDGIVDVKDIITECVNDSLSTKIREVTDRERMGFDDIVGRDMYRRKGLLMDDGDIMDKFRREKSIVADDDTAEHFISLLARRLTNMANGQLTGQPYPVDGNAIYLATGFAVKELPKSYFMKAG